MMHTKNESGYIALIAVLIVGAVSLAATVGVLLSGTDTQRSVLTQQQSAQALGLATSCAEESLQLMHDTTTFTGSGNMSLGTGSCLYTITNTGGQNRVIDTTGTVDNVVRKLKVYVTIGSTSISITSWQEVADAS